MELSPGALAPRRSRCVCTGPRCLFLRAPMRRHSPLSLICLLVRRSDGVPAVAGSGDAEVQLCPFQPDPGGCAPMATGAAEAGDLRGGIETPVPQCGCSFGRDHWAHRWELWQRVGGVAPGSLGWESRATSRAGDSNLDGDRGRTRHPACSPGAERPGDLRASFGRPLLRNHALCRSAPPRKLRRRAPPCGVCWALRPPTDEPGESTGRQHTD